MSKKKKLKKKKVIVACFSISQTVKSHLARIPLHAFLIPNQPDPLPQKLF